MPGLQETDGSRLGKIDYDALDLVEMEQLLFHALVNDDSPHRLQNVGNRIHTAACQYLRNFQRDCDGKLYCAKRRESIKKCQGLPDLDMALLDDNDDDCCIS